MSKTKVATYTADDIKQLEFPENVQMRPGMYIGGNDSAAMLTCVREVVNNSVDEFLAGHCTHIHVKRAKNQTVTVSDNGRGVPFDTHSSGIPALEVIFGSIHSGKNFVSKDVYSTGINGVGSACVNAMSSMFRVESFRKDTKGIVEFTDGYMKESKTVKKCKPLLTDKAFANSSTVVTFNLSPTLFEPESEIEIEGLYNLIQEAAHLNSGLTFKFEDEISGVKETFSFKNGVAERLKFTTPKSIVPVITFESDIVNDTKIEVALTYTDKFDGDEIESFCNTVNTLEGGTHVTGFKRSISQKILETIKTNNLVKEKNVSNEDIFIGLKAIVSVFTFNPKYASQTKTKLSNTEVMGHVVQYTNRALDEWLATNPKELKVIAAKIELAAKARLAQRRAVENVKRDNGTMLSSMGDISKFSDCIERNTGRTELFICEGDSAGGTVGVGRDKDYQALFRLRGKILNTFDMELYQARKNKEVDDLVNILRCGHGKDFDISKLRFDKIIFLADADDDGKHIELLLATFFNQYFKPLIEAGHVYVGVSPLYKVSCTGKDPVYLNTTDDLTSFFNEQFSSEFNFVKGGKKLTVKQTASLSKTLLEYKALLENAAEKYSTPAHTFEEVFLSNYIEDEGDFNFGKSKIEMNVNEETNMVSFMGFYQGLLKDSFISVNTDIDEFLEDLDELNALLKVGLEIEFQSKKGDPLKTNTLYEAIEIADKKVRSVNRIGRFKGLK